MLERLDEIDWIKLGDPEAPAMLRALASPAAETRESARDWMFDGIMHQGTLYSQAPHVVPFLIELVAEPSVEDKVWIVVLLHAIATGTSSSERLVAAARAAVREGLQIYVPLLDHDDPQVRTYSAPLVALFGAEATHLMPVLRQRLEVERDPVARASTLVALAALPHQSEDCAHLQEWTAQEARHGGYASVRIGAAIALSKSAPTLIPPEAVDLITACVIDPRSDNASVPTSLWDAFGDLGFPTSERELLQTLPPPLRDRAIGTLISAFERGPDADARYLANALLETAFPPVEAAQDEDAAAPVAPAALSGLQRSALAAVVERDVIWLSQQPLYADVHVPGLEAPLTRTAIRRFLTDSD